LPFIAPLIGGLAGGFFVSALGQALIGTALSLAMGALARRLAPSPDQQDIARGAHLRLVADANMPRMVLLGEAAVAGSLVYHNVYNQTRNLELVIALADHECEALTGIWIDGKAVTWNSSTGLVTEYPGMRIRFYNGSWTQTADPDLIANASSPSSIWFGVPEAKRWSVKNRGRGVCYVAIDMAFNADLYRGRQPNFMFKVKGAKLYDWRKDATAGGSGAHRWGQPATYEWSDNPAVCWYNFRRGIYVNTTRIAGMGTAADALPIDAATAAANACDESVGLKGGGTEKRYRLSAVFPVVQKHRDTIREMVTACAGVEIDSGGEFRFAPGVAQSTVMALTDDDLMMETEVEWSGRASRRDLINAVTGSYRDPVQRYEAVPLPPRTSSADEAADGDRYDVRYDLDMVSSATQAQRVQEILRRRARRQGVGKGVFRARTCVLEPGDWVTWTSSRFGWDGKTFEVVTPALRPDLSTELVLREIDTGVFTWTPATDQLDSNSISDLPAGGSGEAALAGVGLETILVQSAQSGTQRPGLRLTWTPPNDPSIIEVEIEVRRQGDAAPLSSRKHYLPEAGQSAWIDGVIGGTVYEARARPVPMPTRATAWSAWVTASNSTDPLIVDFGFPPPGSVGDHQLDAQTRFELSLSTALADVFGSAADDARNALAWSQQAAEGAMLSLARSMELETGIRSEQVIRRTETEQLAQQVTTVTARLDDVAAGVIEEITARATADAALAQSVTAATTRIDDNEATAALILQSIDGLESRIGLSVSQDGQIIGAVTLEGTPLGSQFTVVADRFLIAHPTTPGNTIQAFVVGTVDDTPTVGINGNLVIDGTILARHINALTLSAISANIGQVTAGLLRSADNKMRIDLDNKSIVVDVDV
jgi:hypothetical protein